MSAACLAQNHMNCSKGLIGRFKCGCYCHTTVGE